MKTNNKNQKQVFPAEACHTSTNPFHLLNTPFINMLKESILNPENEIATDKLEAACREFAGSVYTCFGAGADYPDLYRLAALTKAELIMLRNRFVRTGAGEKCAYAYSRLY